MKDEFRDIYMQTEIPEELPGLVEGAIRRGTRRARRRRTAVRIASPILAACAVFVLMLNTVPTFAGALYEVPVLGDVCRVLTVRRDHYEDDKKNVDIEVPAIDVELGGADWADSVNQLIQATVNAEVAQSEARAEEYYDAFIATGGTPEEYHPIGIDVDYEVYYASDEVISFAVIKTETLASAYETFHYYNYYLKTGEELTIEDAAGPDWRERAMSALVELVTNPGEGETYWALEDIDLNAVLDEAQFKLDSTGAPVLVFQKYALGPGVMDRPELTLK